MWVQGLLLAAERHSRKCAWSLLDVLCSDTQPCPAPSKPSLLRCTGSSAACPEDKFVASTVTCREPAGICDVEEK